jgi:hypothetical protein
MKAECLSSGSNKPKRILLGLFELEDEGTTILKSNVITA